MNWSGIESGWNDYKGNAKQQWSKLSDEQISDTLSKQETERQISDWQSRQVEKLAPAKN